MADTLGAYLADALGSVERLSSSERVARRYDKFRVMGELA
jgi:hypothetical protein